jgi:signal transduction histidine kinase/CheY-like chemotaxis protein
VIVETIIPLFSMLCYAVLVVIVAQHRPLRREVRLFLIYLTVVMLWSFGSFMVHANFPIRNTLFWNYFLAIWPPFVAIVYFHFVKIFLRKQANPIWLAVGYFFCLIWVIALAKGHIIEQAYFSEGTYHVEFGMGFLILSAIFYSFVGMAVFWIVQEFRGSRDPYIRNRTGYLLMGISVQLSLTASNFLPQAAHYPIDQLGNVINAILIGYAIFRFKLLDIGIVIRKGFLYATLIGSIVAVYFVIALILHTVLQTQGGYATWLSIFLVAILVAVLFHPFYQLLQRRLDELFERKKYNYRQMLRRSSEVMASTINLDELVNWILEELSLTLGIKKISMLLLDSERQLYYLRQNRGYDNSLKGKIHLSNDSPPIKYLIEKNSCLTADDIDRLPTFRALWKREKEELQKLDAAVLVPLKAQETVVGILVLGSRKSDETYTSDDIDLLSTLANQAATAVRNAQLYEKSKQAYRELEEAQERLIRSERLKAIGEMSSGIAHDFNNILTSILGRAELSLDKTQDEHMKHSLELIEQSALDAAKIVRRLQDFARVRTDRDFEAVDLNEIIQNTLEMVKPQLDEKREAFDSKIELELNLGEIGLIEGSTVELKESFLNIFVNAIESMPQGGKLTVETKRDSNSTIVYITDTGAGMTNEVSKRIFEPFFTTKGSQGLGMGLSVVYGTISRHNGRITVSSELGKGSTFAIKFPATKRGQEQVISAEPTIDTQNAAILVIDDDEGARQVISETLARAGHKVDTAVNGQEGLSLAQRKSYGLVIADLGMPDISGRQVAKAIKSANPSIPVLLITGWGVQLDPTELKKDGINSIITKPFSTEEILTQVARLLCLSSTGSNVSQLP